MSDFTLSNSINEVAKQLERASIRIAESNYCAAAAEAATHEGYFDLEKFNWILSILRSHRP
jgi:hypothetical protein